MKRNNESVFSSAREEINVDDVDDIIGMFDVGDIIGMFEGAHNYFNDQVRKF